jgi:hypothetical protein
MNNRIAVLIPCINEEASIAKVVNDFKHALPTAILSTGLMLLAFLSVSAGLIFDTFTHGRRELKRLQYLQISPVNQDDLK